MVIGYMTIRNTRERQYDAQDVLVTNGNPNQFHLFGSTNIFYRQISNFIIDLTAVPPVNSAGGGPSGIHWPTAQVCLYSCSILSLKPAGSFPKKRSDGDNIGNQYPERPYHHERGCGFGTSRHLHGGWYVFIPPTLSPSSLHLSWPSSATITHRVLISPFPPNALSQALVAFSLTSPSSAENSARSSETSNSPCET